MDGRTDGLDDVKHLGLALKMPIALPYGTPEPLLSPVSCRGYCSLLIRPELLQRREVVRPPSCLAVLRFYFLHHRSSGICTTLCFRGCRVFRSLCTWDARKCCRLLRLDMTSGTIAVFALPLFLGRFVSSVLLPSSSVEGRKNWGASTIPPEAASGGGRASEAAHAKWPRNEKGAPYFLFSPRVATYIFVSSSRMVYTEP